MGRQQVQVLMGLSAKKLSDLREWHYACQRIGLTRSGMAGTAKNSWSFKRLGRWHFGDSQIARESYLQNGRGILVF
jgi:hypothetical protein